MDQTAPAACGNGNNLDITAVSLFDFFLFIQYSSAKALPALPKPSIATFNSLISSILPKIMIKWFSGGGTSAASLFRCAKVLHGLYCSVDVFHRIVRRKAYSYKTALITQLQDIHDDLNGIEAPSQTNNPLSARNTATSCEFLPAIVKDTVEVLG